ncbi:cAMP-dependent protein kinase [Chloropicon primus]|nr:cAMP-dependent protein kinase [Chloropicon primus]
MNNITQRSRQSLALGTLQETGFTSAKDTAEALKQIKKVRLFQQLPEHTCNYLLEHADRQTVDREQVLFEEEEEGENFYCILSGELAVYQQKPLEIIKTESNYEALSPKMFGQYGLVVNVMEEGHCFGELALADLNNQRQATVIGLAEETTLLVINKKVYDSVLKRTLNIQHLAENYFAILTAPESKRTAKDIQALVQVTKRHTFFQQLPVEAVEQLCHMLRLKKYTESGIIFAQGDEIHGKSCCYIVLKGSVSVHSWASAKDRKGGSPGKSFDTKKLEKKERRSSLLKPGEQSGSYSKSVSPSTGESTALNIEDVYGPCQTSLHAGDFFGESALLSLDKRQETAICREETYLMILTRDQCKNVIGKLGASMSLFIQPEKMTRLLYKSSEDRTEEDLKELVGMMETFKFFSTLQRKQQLEVVKVTKCLKLGADEIVVQQGDPGDAFYIIISGSVGIHQISNEELQRHREAGEARRERLTVEQYYGSCIRVLSIGASFGETALLKGEPRNATVISVEPTELMVLEKEDYDRIIKAVEAEKLKENLEFLSKVSLVGKLPIVELTKLSYFLQVMHIPINVPVLTVGSVSEGLFIIAKGAFKVIAPDPERPGHFMEVALRGEGEIFGLSAISNFPEAFTIKSMSTAKVYYLQNADIPGALSPEVQGKFKALHSSQIKWQKSRIDNIIQVRQKSAAQFSILRPSKSLKKVNKTYSNANEKASESMTAMTTMRRLGSRTATMTPLTPVPSVSSAGSRSGKGRRSGKKTPKVGKKLKSPLDGGSRQFSVRDKINSSGSQGLASGSPPSGKLLDPAMYTPQNRWKQGAKTKIQSSFAIMRAKKAGEGDKEKKMPKWHSTSLPFHRRRMEIDVDLGAKNVTGRSNGSVRLICTTSAEDNSKFTQSQRDPFVKQRQLLDYTRDLVRRARVTETAIAV